MRDKIEGIGLSLPAVLRDAQLPIDLFDQPRVLVTTKEFFALWRAIGNASKDRAAGLLLGTSTKMEQFHPMALAALSTDNLGDAINQMSRYKRLTAPEALVARFVGDEWNLQFHWLLAEEPEPQILTEYCFASMLSLARHGTGTRLTPLRVEFTQPREHTKALSKYFGCPIIYGSAHNAIVFEASDSRRPLITRNSELLALLAPHFDDELESSTRRQSFTDRVREAIQLRLAGRRPSVDDVAESLHLGARTLQRRLQENGSSFQQVLDEARHELARHYLHSALLDLHETAYLLGYEDANSFVRAFRTWEGVPPAHWREAQRSAQTA